MLNEIINNLSDDLRIHDTGKNGELKYDIQRHYKQTIGPKPNGFWYGFGNSWIEWCEYEMPHSIGGYIYSVNIEKCGIISI